MKNNLILSFISLIMFSSVVQAQKAVSPAVPGFGEIYKIEAPDKLPDPTQKYNIVIDVTMASENAESVNYALHNIARLFNLHVSAGVPKENIDIVAVVHSKATTSVLIDKTYKRINNVKNPNKDIIRALDKAGVQLYVCGQSLIARGYDTKEVNPDIGLSVSALTILTEYQMKGYALLKF